VRFALGLVLTGTLAVAPPEASATPPLAAAARSFPRATRLRALGAPRDEQVDVLRIGANGTPSWARVPIESVDSMSGSTRDVSFGAVREALIDRAASEVHASAVRSAPNGPSGRGVVVAIVDTGADVRHADLRRADGSTRIAWLIDYSRASRGVHADLEATFGITAMDGSRVGAVYDAHDLDALLRAERDTGRPSDAMPIDEIGHGTWCASISAGTGLATARGYPAGRYVGMAPDADLVIVRANRDATRTFSDAALVAGASFAVDRARWMHEPVVVNLSLGSHFGAHDGTSALERALARLVENDPPGTAVVVAAGNEGADAIHARADLRQGAVTEIPLVVPAGPADPLVTVQLVYEGTASFSVRLRDGLTDTPWIDRGASRGFRDGDVLVSIANATDEDSVAPSAHASDPADAVRTGFVIVGPSSSSATARSGGTWTLRVTGEGPFHAWISRDDPRHPARFAAGTVAEGTVGVPATSRHVISVGSLVTRLDWVNVHDQHGEVIASTGVTGNAALGALSAFSSRGPNRLNEPVPDVIAPGEWLIAAMSAQATPDVASSIFRSSTSVDLVADDGLHAAQRGTSGATPVVTGVIALLLAAVPNATQEQLRAALASTARRSSGWDAGSGWGEIVADDALAALRSMRTSDAIDATSSEATLTAPIVAMGEATTLMLRLRDALGAAVALPNAALPAATASAGTVERIASRGGGIYEVRWRADEAAASAGRAEFTIAAGAVTLASRATVRVVRSVSNGDSGTTAGNGCATGPRGADARGVLWLAFVASALMRVRRARAIR
jgi:subtilisin family serine protease